MPPFRRVLVRVLLPLVVGGSGLLLSPGWAEPGPASVRPSRQFRDGYLTVHLQGPPEQLGRQQGLLLHRLIRRMVSDLLAGQASTPAQRERLLAGTRIMERYQPPEFLAELRSLAETVGVDYTELLAAQLFGDVWRGLPAQRYGGMGCSSYAVWGDATADGKCYVGRNMDFWDHGIAQYGMVLLHYAPDRGLPFVTASWAGIVNGWTAMNTAGIVCANNTAYGGTESLQGISTCFLVRKVVQYARTVQEGVEIVKRGPRACGTNLIIAGGHPPTAAMVEFDHDRVAVRYSELPDGEAQGSYVIADNSFRRLADGAPASLYGDEEWGRYGLLKRAIRERYGRLGPEDNLAALEGVPMGYLNLQSVFLCPSDLTFQIAMGPAPAYRDRFRRFRLTPWGLERRPEPEAVLCATFPQSVRESR